MTSQTSLNCEKLRDAFEGREAIYIEKGVLRVRVTSIRCNIRQVSATLEEVPTKGLERSLFHRRQINEPRAPLRWNIVAGYLTKFSDHTWNMGYGGWSLFFAPEVVGGFVSIASDWPAELDAMERYNQALRFLEDRNAYKPSKRVFPE
jgi:hypothetical protein